MAETSKNKIYYNDDENSVADVLADMKKMAESTDEAIEKSKYNDAAIKKSISDVEKKQVEKNIEQDSKIVELQNEKAKLETELKEMQEDFYQNSIRGQASGEYIHVEDSSNCRSIIGISGNSKQETRSGKNLLQLTDGTYENNGVTAVVKDGIITLNDTATDTSFIEINLLKSIVLTTEDTYSLSAFNTKTVGDSTNYGALRLNQENIQVLFNKANANGSLATSLTLSYITIRTASGITYDNFVLKPQLELGDGTDTWEQYGASPSPEYSSEVESCGDNVNLFDKDNANILDNAFLNTTDKIITSFTGRKSFYIKIKPNTTYTISRKIIASVFSAGTTEDIPTVNSTLIDVAYNNNGKEMTIITSSNAKYLTIYYKRDIDTSTDEEILDSIKIQKGTTPTPYSPYGQGCINEVVCNKNFINVFSRFVTGYTETVNGVTFTINKDGTVKVNGTNTTDSWTYFLLSTESTAGYDKNSFVDENTYYLAGAPTNSSSSTYRLQFYDASNNKSFYDYGSGVSVKRTASAGWNIAIGVASGVTVNNLVFKPMLLKGNYTGKTLPDYEAHKEQTYTIPTQQPFRGNGDTRDTFIKKNNKWYERHYINRLILNGTESWQISTDTKFFFVTNIISSTDYSKVYCNIALSASSYAELTDGTARAAVRNSGNGIYISNKNNMTLEGWKAWLVEQYNAGGPVYIDYPSITPLDIECTEEQSKILDELNNARTYKNVTNIYSTDEISPILSLDYAKDLETLLNNTQALAVNNASEGV